MLHACLMPVQCTLKASNLWASVYLSVPKDANFLVSKSKPYKWPRDATSIPCSYLRGVWLEKMYENGIIQRKFFTKFLYQLLRKNWNKLTQYFSYIIKYNWLKCLNFFGNIFIKLNFFMICFHFPQKNQESFEIGDFLNGDIYYFCHT